MQARRGDHGEIQALRRIACVVRTNAAVDRVASRSHEARPESRPSLATPKRLLLLASLSLAAGVAAWALGAGIVALWLFFVAAAVVALALPLPQAIVSPLFMGLVGWLVDMLPLVILVGWATVVVRWIVDLVRSRSLPRGGRWIWLPVGLLAWTALGIVSVAAAERKHFILLLGLQFLVSGTVLLAVDRLGDLRARTSVMTGLLAFVVLLSAGVFLRWVGVPLESLQDDTVSGRVEAAYGVDAFRNSTGMIKYARAKNAGVGTLRTQLAAARKENPEFPRFVAFLPLFDAFDKTNIVVRFQGSAREVERELNELGVELIYDNVGIAPAHTVPRLRSFPRNALTYAGVSAALFPFAFFFTWSADRRRKFLGIAAIASCLFGAGFSLARGAWVAIAIGCLYLLVDGALSWRRKAAVIGAFVAGAAVLTGVYFAKYHVDPLTARAGGESSVNARSDLYGDTVDTIGASGLHLIVGFGTERERGGGELGKYVPSAGTHSTYLNYLVRTGIPGGLAAVALYALAGLHARAASRVRGGSERCWATLASAAVIVVSAHALILSLFVEPIYTLTVSLVLGIAMAGATALPAPILPWRTRAAR